MLPELSGPLRMLLGSLGSSMPLPELCDPCELRVVEEPCFVLLQLEELALLQLEELRASGAVVYWCCVTADCEPFHWFPGKAGGTLLGGAGFPRGGNPRTWTGFFSDFADPFSDFAAPFSDFTTSIAVCFLRCLF